MTHELAIATARRFREAESLDIGPLSRSVLTQGEWLACFAYNGPPPEEVDHVDCPGRGLPTGVVVDDETGEPSRMDWL